MTDRTTVLIASWLEPELVERVRAAAPDMDVVYEPDLLRPPRYPADHMGRDVDRSPEQEARWLGHLARADILFDFDATHRDDLPDRAPRVRWIQATSAGIGQFVRRQEYARRMPEAVFTTASGVHAGPLAEFAVLAMLGHARRLLHTVEAQGRRHWERYAGGEVAGRTAVVVGYGAIGREVGRLARALGVRVVGVKRTVDGDDPGAVHADELLPSERLAEALPRADYLVLTAPHTEATEGMIGARELAELPDDAVLVNIGRGALVDEPALIEALAAGRPAEAWLDVFAEEPLPADSPLWSMPNVLVSPHSASTSTGENGRIVDLFCENLSRWRAGRPLRNLLDPDRLY